MNVDTPVQAWNALRESATLFPHGVVRPTKGDSKMTQAELALHVAKRLEQIYGDEPERPTIDEQIQAKIDEHLQKLLGLLPSDD